MVDVADIEEPTLVGETRASLVRIQEFDVDSLPRVAKLGEALHFQGAVEPAQRLIALYKRLSPIALEDFPDSDLQQIKKICDSDHYNLQQVLDFDPTEGDQPPRTIRDQYIQRLEKSYEPAFKLLSPYISYSLHRSADFQRLDADARATLQAITDKSDQTQKALNKHEEDAKKVLEDIRETAAEQGVTQQAIYFKSESGDHDTAAEKWETRTIGVAIVLALFAIGSIFLYKWDYIAPQNTFETVQLVTSKILIFAVLTYLLILSAKNYLNHKHNSIVNKHRQNALMTYKAMIDATDDLGSREAILIQAASCIYSPQTTGYAPGSDAPAVSGKSMVEILSKPVVQAASNASKAP